MNFGCCCLLHLPRNSVSHSCGGRWVAFTGVARARRGKSVTDATRGALRNLLANNCMSLSQRLARGLGGSHPSDASVQEPASSPHCELGATATTPGDGILQLALGIAADRRRADGRKLTPNEIDALLHADEQVPAELDFSLQELQWALAGLPAFTRAVFEVVLVDRAARGALAKRFGVTVSAIDGEVQKALEHGLQHLQQKNGAP